MSERAARKIRRFGGWLFLAATLILLDQWGKYAILARFEPGEALPVTSFFNLVLTYNPGAAFSFLAWAGGWQKWFFAFFALAVSVWILLTLWKQPEQKRQNCALTLIMGGAIGNLADRLIHGAVVDFLDFYLGSLHWPAFNIADSCITLGAFLLILDAVLTTRDRPSS